MKKENDTALTQVQCCESPSFKGIEVYDDGSDFQFAHNIDMCYNCGAVRIERVWSNPGVTLIKSNGNVETINKHLQ